MTAAVGQLGDNTLTPADIDMSGLDIEAGEYFVGPWVRGLDRA